MLRRDFIAKGAATSLALGTFPNIIVAKKHRVYTVGLIGSGWWGMNILTTAIASGTVKTKALCDVDQRQMDEAKAKVKELTGDSPKLYSDFREMLAKEKLDIVIVATPDHWHAIPAIAALKSGAHVYVEKPLVLNEVDG